MQIEIGFQPFGDDGATWTLGQRLLAELSSGRYGDCLAGIAFVTSSGTSRLAPAIRSLVRAGGSARIVCGIGNGVTSRQAVEHLHAAGAIVDGIAPGPRLLFHEKVVRLIGPESGLVVIGSNNLTVDGLFRHFEGACLITLDPSSPTEAAALRALDRHLEFIAHEYPDHVHALRPEALDKLVDDGLLRDETAAAPRSEEVPPDDSTDGRADSTIVRRPQIPVPAPPPPDTDFPLPPVTRGTRRVERPEGDRGPAPAPIVGTPEVPATAGPTFLIQIRPHHNGEIFLSTTAANENPGFFGMPFTGTTTPKKPGNPAYPKRDPDPRVNLAVYDGDGRAIYRLTNHEAYLYDYGKKSDLRLNLRDPIYKNIAADSILVMSMSDGVAYSLDVWTPGSERYDELLGHCTSQMSAGGSGIGRRYGWL